MTPNSNEQYVRSLLAKQKPLPLTNAQKVAALVATLETLEKWMRLEQHVSIDQRWIRLAQETLAKVKGEKDVDRPWQTDPYHWKDKA